MGIRPSFATLVAGLFVASAGATEPTSPFDGRWITESGNLEIEIAPCGGAWCGTVTRELGRRSMSAQGQPMTPVDRRPALGMQILKALKLSSDRTVLSGDIYNREDAKTYSVRLSLDAARQLQVRPYVLLPLFGKTQLWQRAPTLPLSLPHSAASEPLPPGSAR